MKLSLSVFVLFSVVTCLCASPLPSSRVRYDQRQEGDLNVRADLENFVILVIPTSASTSASSLGLLDLLSKAIPIRAGNKRNKHVKKSHSETNRAPVEIEPDEETQAFIESKTAPYHVDITKSRKNLAKLHPAPTPQTNERQEELLVSPNLSLIKGEELEAKTRSMRSLRARGYVLSLPLEVDESTVHIDKKRIEKSNNEPDFELSLKQQEKENPSQRVLTLIGVEHDEDCGPGYQRGSNGICNFVEHV